MKGTVKVSGLRQLSRALKQVGPEAPKELRKALNESAEFLVGKVKPQIPVRKGSARASLKVRSTRTLVRVSAGGRKAPYYPWLDFGGRVGRKKRTVRKFYSDGRYLYPTLARERDEFAKILQDAVVRTIENSGLEVH